jgi:transcriptional regulator with XRE-family HTH domain
MDDRQAGAILRVLRTRKRWRQQDVASKAGVPRGIVVAMEAGRFSDITIGRARSVAEACGGWFDLRLRTPGDDRLRMLNAEHSRLQDWLVARLQAIGWEVIPEASFSIYGERGVIDILAWHPPLRALLIAEVKTALVDVGALLATNDRRLRLAVRIATEREWAPLVVGSWVAVKNSSTNRQRLAANAQLIRSALPDDGRYVGPWLNRPDRPLRALGFLPNVVHGDTNEARPLRRRVRTRQVGHVMHDSKPRAAPDTRDEHPEPRVEVPVRR